MSRSPPIRRRNAGRSGLLSTRPGRAARCRATRPNPVHRGGSDLGRRRNSLRQNVTRRLGYGVWLDRGFVVCAPFGSVRPDRDGRSPQQGHRHPRGLRGEGLSLGRALAEASSDSLVTMASASPAIRETLRAQIWAGHSGKGRAPALAERPYLGRPGDKVGARRSPVHVRCTQRAAIEAGNSWLRGCPRMPIRSRGRHARSANPSQGRQRPGHRAADRSRHG